jgi:hypothetical protein
MVDFPTLRRVRAVIRARYGRWIVNTVWGHLIYKPIPRGRFTVPYGMKTLDEFIRFHERQNREQSRSDHPLVLEIFCSVTIKRTLTYEEVKAITSILRDELDEELFSPLLGETPEEDWFEWGYDYEETDFKLETEARKRMSKNGEDFIEENISKRFSHLEDRLR